MNWKKKKKKILKSAEDKGKYMSEILPQIFPREDDPADTLI